MQMNMFDLAFLRKYEFKRCSILITHHFRLLFKKKIYYESSNKTALVKKRSSQHSHPSRSKLTSKLLGVAHQWVRALCWSLHQGDFLKVKVIKKRRSVVGRLTFSLKNSE